MITKKQIEAVDRAREIESECSRIDDVLERMSINKKIDRYFKIGHSPGGGPSVEIPGSNDFYPVIFQALKFQQSDLERQRKNLTV